MEGKNHANKLKQYARRTKPDVKYEEVFSEEPGHNRKFLQRVVVNGQVCPTGEGRDKQQDKQNAAENALSFLLEKNLQLAANDDHQQGRVPLKFVDPNKPRLNNAALFEVGDETATFGKTKKKAAKLAHQELRGSKTTEVPFRSAVADDGAPAGPSPACNQLKALREVNALSKLRHANIVRYNTCWVEDLDEQWHGADDTWSSSRSNRNSSAKFLYIQMELCDTKTLRGWIEDQNKQNMMNRRRDGLTIIKQIVSGVECIHSNGFIHRDLKPDNIMFGRDGEVKIGDFGLVTADRDDSGENLLERTVYKGTPSYMAPEQKSEQTYDRKVDIFAIGLIFFEVLWRINSVHEKQKSIIIKSMLCVNPEGRPEASKLKADMERNTCSYKTEEDSDLQGALWLCVAQTVQRVAAGLFSLWESALLQRQNYRPPADIRINMTAEDTHELSDSVVIFAACTCSIFLKFLL
ncbi:hypothetical protein PAMP_001881 [Pampus punctatissimus]